MEDQARRQMLAALGRRAKENASAGTDAIPLEEFGERIRLSDEQLVGARAYAQRLLDTHAKRLEQLATGGTGYSLLDLERELLESHHSAGETALVVYAAAEYLGGRTAEGGSLEDLRFVLEEASKLPWYRKALSTELSGLLERVYDDISNEGRMDRNARALADAQVRGEEQYDLSKERLAARTAQAELETAQAEERTAELNLEKVEAEAEVLKGRAEIEVREGKERFSDDLRERIIDLETQKRHGIMRVVCEETGYILTKAALRKAVSEELTPGCNLRHLPWHMEVEEGEYVKDFLRRHLGDLVTARLETVEGDKDHVMLDALELMVAKYTGTQELPSVRSVTIGNWEDALRENGHLDELVAIYTMAKREDGRLTQAIAQKLQEEADTEFGNLARGVTTYLERLFFKAELVERGREVSDGASFVEYKSRVKAEIFRTLGNLVEPFILRIGDRRIYRPNLNSGLYVVQLGTDEKLFVRPVESNNSEWDWLRRNNGFYTSFEQLHADVEESDVVEGVSFDDYFEEAITHVQDNGPVPISLALAKYHPHLDIEFAARELYNLAMVARFEGLNTE
jgi:hypothetical protein